MGGNHTGRDQVYVCNCNGIRERDVRAAIEAGARRPREIFQSRGCTPRCARCVCDMKDMIDETRRVLALAAE